MAFDVHKNFAVSAVAVAPVTATAGTALTVTAGQGSRFPTVPFNATICPAGTNPTPANAEVVRVTVNAADVMTITRAQEGSSARTVIVGDQIFAAVTAKSLTDIEDVTQWPAALKDAVFPWTIQVLPFTNDAAAKTGTWNLSQSSAEFLGGEIYNGTAGQNDEIAYDLILAAGTWTFSLLFSKNTNSAIHTVTIGGSSVGTIDSYNGSLLQNQVATITGITVATSGKARVALKAATKNASASNYYLVWQMFQMKRTA